MSTFGHRENCRFKGRLGAVAIGSKSVSFQPPPFPKFPNTAIPPSLGRKVPPDGAPQPNKLMEMCQSLPR